MKTLYVTDLDGTFLNREGRLSGFARRTVQSLVSSGLLFTFATARSLSSASRAMEGLDLRTPVITYNGVFLIRPDTGEILEKNCFTQMEAERIQDLMEKLDISPLVYSIIDGRERLSWDVTRQNPGRENYLSRRKGDRRLRPLLDGRGLYDGEIFYFLGVGKRDELLPLQEAVKNDNRCISFLQKELYQPEYFCEIMPAEATKANAIRRLKALLGCGRVITFGDAVNDIPMFQVSDECYAVENAVEELKAAATGVIPSNEQDGVAKWLLENSVTDGNAEIGRESGFRGRTRDI